METRDGFIIGVYNYCNRWCERCGLATRCHVYVDVELERQGIGASWPPFLAPGARSLGAVALTDLSGESAAGGCGEAKPEPGEAEESPSVVPPPSLPRLTGAAETLDRRSRALGYRLLDWPVPVAAPAAPEVAGAIRIIGHYAVFLGPKVHRAMIGQADQDEDEARDPQNDANGSAKAALLALDELEAAWLRIAEAKLVGLMESQPVFAELAWIKTELERLFPHARAFVRPGFDEPEAVAMLEWRERG